MLQSFLAVIMVMNAFLAIIWNPTNWVDKFIKVAFVGTSIWAGILLGMDLGYIVKV